MTGYTDRAADQRKIHGWKRCHPEMQDHEIDDTKQQPYYGHQCQYKYLSLEIHSDRQGQHNDQYIKHK